MDAADPIREKVRTALAPHIAGRYLYPYQRFADPLNPVPQKHAQLYAGSEGLGRPGMTGEYTDIVYLNLFAAKESEVKAMREAVRFLDGYVTPGSDAAAGLWSYSLQSATTLEEADGTMHLALLYQATYIRQITYVA